MTRTLLAVERVRDRFDRAAQRSLTARKEEAKRLAEANRREVLIEAVRDDVERATAALPPREAHLYLFELQREARRRLGEAAAARTRAPTARETAEAAFQSGRAA